MTSKRSLACVAFRSTSPYRPVFARSETIPPKTKPPVAIAANHGANQLRYEENTGCRWERAPLPPTCTWQTIPAVTHLLPCPHPPPQLRINSPSWPSRSHRRNCMNIHTGLRFGQEDLDVEMVTGGGLGGWGVPGSPSAPHLGVATAWCRRALGRLDPAR